MTFDYIALTGPVQLEAAEVAQSQDRWQPRYADRVSERVRPPQFPQPSMPIYLADVTVTVDGLAWMGQLPRDPGPYRWVAVPSGMTGVKV